MTTQLRHTLCDHAAGNTCILTTLAAELLTDEAAIEIRDFLQAFIVNFESHYGAQIHRYDADRSRENLRCARKATPWGSSDPVDDPPFFDHRWLSKTLAVSPHLTAFLTPLLTMAHHQRT